MKENNKNILQRAGSIFRSLIHGSEDGASVHKKACSEKADGYERKTGRAGVNGGGLSSAGNGSADISADICRGLGGKTNIAEVDACETRLRITVETPDLVSDDILRATGARGVVRQGNGIQIVYGPKVSVIRAAFEKYLAALPDEAAADKKQTSAADDARQEKKREGKPVSTIEISSPITGEVHDLSETPDKSFAGRIIGDGVMVIPTDPVICAPEDGRISMIFNTKHAIGFKTDTGADLLIHVGIDTVGLQGRGFTVLAEAGQRVKKGEPMLQLDLEYIRDHAPSLATPVLNVAMGRSKEIRRLASGRVQVGEPLFAIDTYEEDNVCVQKQ